MRSLSFSLLLVIEIIINAMENSLFVIILQSCGNFYCAIEYDFSYFLGLSKMLVFKITN